MKINYSISDEDFCIWVYERFNVEMEEIGNIQELLNLFKNLKWEFFKFKHIKEKHIYKKRFQYWINQFYSCHDLDKTKELTIILL